MEVMIMAIIAMFYGIIVSMYYLDNKRHHVPHIHVKYQGQDAVIAIPDGKILEGDMKSNKMKLIQAWIEIHQDELMADWELAASGETVFKIEPLK
jgi:shikimate kinase